MREVVVLLLLIGFIAWVYNMPTQADREAEAIQRGYALHCPQTGEFAWKGECDE